MSKETETIEEEIREQHQKLKDMSLKERLGYLFYYYKWHALVTILVIIFLGYLFTSIFLRPQEAFYAILLDIDHPMTVSTLIEEDFAASAGMTAREKAVFDTSITLSSEGTLFASDAYDSTIRLNALIMAEQVDVICGPASHLESYEEEGILTDISELLDPDTLARLKEKGLVYTVTHEDGTSADRGILISDSEVFASYSFYEPDTEVYAYMIYNAPHEGMFQKFADFLYPAEE